MKILRFFALVAVFLTGTVVSVMAQNLVKGTVVDKNGEPVIGAAVYLLENPTTGAVTDQNGNWSLVVTPGSTLHFSSLGFLDKDIKPGNQAVINVVMDEDVNMLNDVVVIGYGTVQRKNFTGSVSTVKVADAPVSQVAMTNPVKTLKGTMTGLDVGYGPKAGDDPAVLVRGVKSISAFKDDHDNKSYTERTSSPLIVLDGVIFNGSLTEIDPNIIQDMSVLKDATSLAAYGSQAANGVIMITTKRGTTEKPVINFSSSVGLSNVAMKPKLMSMDNYKTLRSLKHAGVPDADPATYLSDFEKITYDAGKISDAIDYITRPGVLQTYSASVSGITKKTNYLLSGTYNDQKGVVIGDDYKRMVFNIKLTTDITDWLQVGARGNVSFNDYSGLTVDSVEDALIMSPYAMFEWPDGQVEKYPGGGTNPLWGVLSGTVDDVDKRNSYEIGGHVLVKAPWVEGLSFRMNGNYRIRNINQSTFQHEGYFVTQWDGVGDPEDRYQDLNTKIYLSSANGTVTESQKISWVWDNILNYNRRFGDHFIDASLVYTRDSNEYMMHKHTGTDFSTLGNTILGAWALNKASVPLINAPEYWRHTDVGYLARVQYAYKDRYHFNASVRRDGSSVFGADKKWGVFPAVGVAWTVSNEPFMASLKPAVSYLKLKASWGKNGNQSLSPYQTLTTITMGQAKNYYTFGNNGKPNFREYLGTLGSTDLGWETTESFNYGFELGLFEDRVLLEYDGYSSKTYDQIFIRAIPIVLNGQDQMYATMGQINNWGMEVNLTTRNIRTQDWNWTSKLSFYLNRSKIQDIYGDGTNEIVDINHAYLIGEPLGIFYGQKEIGIIQAKYDASGKPMYDDKGNLLVSDEDQAYVAVNGGVPGDVKFLNVTDGEEDEPGVINSEDRTILGNRYPNFQMSFMNDISWKNFDLYMLFTGTFGGNGYCLWPNTQAFVCYDRSSHSEIPRTLDHEWWTVENRNNTYPRPAYIKNEYEPHMSWAYVRLQNISLSYRLKKSLLERSKIAGLKLYVSAENLLTFTNWEGGDPEMKQTRTNYNYPFYKTYTFGVNLTF